MIIHQTEDAELIKSVLFDPKIKDAISEDGGEIIVPANSICLAGFAPDLVGLFVCVPHKNNVFDVHVHVLPEHRKKHSADFGNAVVEWVWSNTECQRMIAKIPFCCENVKKFAEMCGFSVIGALCNGWKKRGIIYDCWLLENVRA